MLAAGVCLLVMLMRCMWVVRVRGFVTGARLHEVLAWCVRGVRVRRLVCSKDAPACGAGAV